ncbi:acetyl-CoA synthetase-like protein [Phanerochaete sordida]|uniref:Acetyl-CoA synthetase-like protein n=1 Tax=Phanerochaete sordida TaxID=48140 RepID=A0A9P3LGA0_9APHY|nr:acetyl-CoA synthetase-like protein [Phanerochaete sordida]
MDPKTVNPDTLKFLPIAPPPKTQGLATTTFVPPPLDGSLTIAEMWDWHAAHSPAHPFFEYSDDTGHVTAIKAPEAANAMHRAGRIVRAVLDAHPAAERRPIVALLASSDTITYTTVLAGVQRAGAVAFPISPRNSPAAVAHLLARTRAPYVLLGREAAHQDLAAGAFAHMRLAGAEPPRVADMPVFEDVYNAGEVEPLPPLHADLDEPTVMMHSSGSTAFPKPITWTHYRQLMNGRAPFYGEQDFTGLRFACHTLAIFHAMGILQTCFQPVVGSIMTAFAPQSPARVPTPEAMLSAVAATKSDMLICVPSFVEEWAKIPASIEVLQKTKGVLYGGGPLAKEVGDQLTEAGIPVLTIYGTSEYGAMNMLLPRTVDKDWEYFSMPKELKAHLMPHDDGNVQLILLPSPFQVPSVINVVVDGVPGYDTNDVLAPHPTKPGFYKVFGRADDQIMHSTGEKTNPGPLEAILNQDPHIRCAVVFGRGKFNAGIVVEPKPEFAFDPADTAKLSEFRNKIWPTVERVNEFAPQHSRLFKEMILVASPDKPFTYTAKNTARRPAIINEYADEIEALYAAADETSQADLPPPSSWEPAPAKAFVRAVVSRVLGHTPHDDDDLFQHGCDSLEATWIRNSLLHALRDTTPVDTRAVPGNFVYQHPTIAALAAFASELATARGAQGSEQERAVRFMLSTVEKYTRDLPAHVPVAPAPTDEVVLVTGTTGGLGAALLAQLVQSAAVTRVYALNRKSSTPLAERQRASLAERGYDVDLVASPKLVLVETAVEDSKIGVEDALYEEIRTSVTRIIHNAWPVNFNMSLRSFEPSVHGVRNLIDLALASPFPAPPPLAFVSSIGVFRDIDVSAPVLERTIDAHVAAGSGYSESKWVSETILRAAARERGLRAVSVRVGQMTGSRAGAWNAQEWFPSLVKSSVFLGCIPVLDKTISWIPLDAAATALIEMSAAPAPTLHLAHPRPVAWRAVTAPIAAEFGLEEVSYDAWMARLEKSGRGLSAAEEVDMMRRNPALKLFEFFKEAQDFAGRSPEAMGLPQMDVSEAQEAAPSLRALPQLSDKDAMSWVGYWKKIGHLE